MKIPGGYILQPREIDNSWISDAPPHVREIWFYLLRRANHKPKKTSGKTIFRGQMHTSYRQIINDLSWKVGFRKESYKKHQIETAMKLLTARNMATTTKTTRGMIVTICNYDFYQNPKNYETDSETDNENHNRPTGINKNVKNDKNNIGDLSLFTQFWNKYHQITGLRKTDKEATLKYWKKLKQSEQEKALEAIKPYFNSLNDPKFCKKARTYLADKNFNDEFSQSKFRRSNKTTYKIIS